MTKQGGKGKHQGTLNEKYEMHLNSKRMINKKTHKTKTTNYNKVQVLYYQLDLGVTI